MAYKVVETDAVRDELVRTLDYLEFVLFEPSFEACRGVSGVPR